MPKETNYEHNYITDDDGKIVPEKRLTVRPVVDPLIECLERITLALQGIELAFDKHNEHSGYDKDNQKLEKLLQQGDDE